VSWSLVALVLGEFAFVAWVLWLVGRALQERARRRAELQARLFDRFGSAQELVAFLETEQGRRLQDALSGRRGRPHARILAAVQIGVILLALGVGLFVLAWITGQNGMLAVAVVTVALAVGFLASAWASHGLSKAWGLLAGAERSRDSLRA